MKYSAAILCLVILLALASPLYAAPPSQDGSATLILTNESNEPICFVQISPTTANDWGAKKLGALPSETITFDVEPGKYNVRLWDCANNILLEERNITVNDTYTLAFIEPVGRSCDDLNQAGVSLYKQTKYRDALEQFVQASTCYQKIGDQAGEGNSLHNIGVMYSNLGQYEATLDYLQQALTIRQEIGDRTSESSTLNNIGIAYESLGQYEQALDYYQQGLTIQQEIGDRSGEGRTLNSISNLHSLLGVYDSALESAQKALAINQKIGDRENEATSLKSIGLIYFKLGQYDQALDYNNQALIIYQEIGDRSGEGNSLNGQGNIYLNLGQYEKALDYFQQSLAIENEIGSRIGEVDNLLGIGTVYLRLGRYKEGLDYTRQALAISQEIGDRFGQGIALNDIGALYGDLGEYELALNHLQQALAIRHELGNQQEEGITLRNIGSIYDRLGQYETALDYTRKALAISQEIGDRFTESKNLSLIGRVYYNLQQYELALDYTQQALSLSQEIGDRFGEGESLNNIATIFSKLGKDEQSLEYHQQVLIIMREVGDRFGEGASLNNISATYYNLGQYEQALDYGQQALAIKQEIGDRFGEGISLSNIGDSYKRLGQIEQSLDYYRQAAAVLESIRAEAGTEQGRADFIVQYNFLYRGMIALFYQQEQPEQAFEITEQGRARAFLDALATGQVRLRDNDAAELLAQEQELYVQRQAIRFELVEAKANNPDRVTELEQQLAEVEAAYEEIQKAIAARGAELASLVPGRSADTVLGVEQVQPLLDDKTTLLAYYQLENNILAFILTRNSFETVALNVDPAEVDRQIKAFREFANTTAAYPASAVDLYEMLITPLKDKLTTPHLAVIPHQQLHYLPFAALTDGERYLIDDYTLTVLPSASSLPFIQENAQQTAYSGQPSALIAGNPVTADNDTVASLATTRDSLGSLPFAEKEAKAIAKLFGVEPLIGEAATESTVREQVAKANILHLAAHGQFNPVAPLNSLIALAPDDENDGWLTVGESYGLNLENTDLVVLSACETNLGDLSAGDELVGLTRALIFAGTPSVIASLWAVEDEASSLLMERFYTHLKDGVGKAEALRQAQIEVREEYPSPYYWSGFVLSGDPGIEPGSAAASPIEASEGQSSGNCLSLLLILGAMASVGVVVRRRNG